MWFFWGVSAVRKAAEVNSIHIIQSHLVGVELSLPKDLAVKHFCREFSFIVSFGVYFAALACVSYHWTLRTASLMSTGKCVWSAE